MDAVIIGGGPAGIAAAITAARAGLTVTVITKPPGARGEDSPLESVHPGIESLLKTIGAEGALQYASRARYNGIYTTGRFEPLNPEPGEIWEGDHICRQAFDAYLLGCARRQHVAIIEGDKLAGVSCGDEGSRVTLSSGTAIECSYLIDASGRQRVLGKKLKFEECCYAPPLTTWSGVAVGVSPAFFETTGTSLIPEGNGWTWLAPQPPDRCTWTRLSPTKAASLLPPPELADFGQAGSIRTANVQWRLFKPVAGPGVLLCGDAAGILDPGAGQGILNALFSGIMAAQTLINIAREKHRASYWLSEYNNWFISNFEERAERLKQRYEELGIWDNLSLTYDFRHTTFD